MALINCLECGKEISDTVKICPHCGYKYTKKMSRKKKKGFVILLILFALITIALASFLIFINIIVPTREYAQGEKLLEGGNYIEAIEIFKGLDDFKDSKLRIKESYYKYGEYLTSFEKYDEAIEAFKNASDFADASKKIDEVEIIKNKNTLMRAYEACTSSGTKLSADGLSISVDSSGEYDYISLTDVYIISGILQLPNSLTDAMISTNSLMGRLTEQHGDFEISWSFHPDNGLDVIFKIIEE